MATPVYTYNGPISLTDYTFTVTITPSLLNIVIVVLVHNNFSPIDPDPRKIGQFYAVIDGELRNPNGFSGTPNSGGDVCVLIRNDPDWIFTFTLNRLTMIAPSGLALIGLFFAAQPNPQQVPIVWVNTPLVDLSPYAVILPPGASYKTVPRPLSTSPLQPVYPSIVRSMFTLNPGEIIPVPGLLAQIETAAVNTMTFSVFSNPADNGWTTIEQWRANSLPQLNSNISYSLSNGFAFLGTGDDWFRSTLEQDWVINTSWAEQASKEDLTILHDSSICIGIEAEDEGPSSPTGISQAYSLWRQWTIDVGVKVSWPNQAPYGMEQGTLPNGQPWADYASRFWVVEQGARPDSFSLYEMALGLANAAKFITLPWLCQIAVNGPNYDKGVAGSNYNPNGDHIKSLGVQAQDIVAQGWIALAYGCSGFRCYGYDYSGWVGERANSLVGTTNLQTGTKPGDARWPGLSRLFNSVSSREGILLQSYSPTVIDYPWIFGFRPPHVWAVNVSEVPLLLTLTGTLIMVDGESDFNGGLVPAGGVVFSSHLSSSSLPYPKERQVGGIPPGGLFTVSNRKGM